MELSGCNFPKQSVEIWDVSTDGNMYQLILGWVKLPMKLPYVGEISVCELLLLRMCPFLAVCIPAALRAGASGKSLLLHS